MLRLASKVIKPINIIFKNKIVLALIVASIHLALCLFMAPYDIDIKHDGYVYKPAVDFIHGAIIHRDTFQQYGPLANAFASLTLFLFGEKLIILRYYIAAVYALITFLLFLILAEIMPRWVAFLSAFIYALISPHAFIGLEPNPVHDGILVSLLALLLLIQFLKSGKRIYIFLTGLTIGLACGIRTTMGVYVSLATLLFLFLEPFMQERIYIKKLITNIFTGISIYVTGFAISISLIILWLYSNNALKDWYLQTIVWPPLIFNLTNTKSYFDLWYWGTINRMTQSIWFFPMMGIAGMLAALKGFQEKNKILFLAALFSVSNWPNAMPNGCPAHQWWAMTIGIGLFVYMLWYFAGRGKTIVGNICLTAVILFIVSGYVQDNYRVLKNKLKAQTSVVEKPELLKGMKTEPQNVEWITGLNSMLEKIRSKYPKIKLVSFGKNIQVPLLLCFIDDNRTYPIWIEWEYLDKVYPNYINERNEYIRREIPLLITDDEENIKEDKIGGYETYKFGRYFLLVPEEINDSLSGENIKHTFPADSEKKQGITIALQYKPNAIMASSRLSDEFSEKDILEDYSPIWHSRVGPTYPQWIEFEYSEQVVINGITVEGQPGGWKRAPAEFYFQGQSDDGQWVDLLYVNGNSISETENSKSWAIENNNPFKHYRLYILKNNGAADYVTIKRIKFDYLAE